MKNLKLNATPYNGTNNGHTLNAHLSYKGRSVIIDYEFCLHCYSELKRSSRNEFVPFEIYPYGYGDIYIGYVEVDKTFHKADMEKLIEILDEAIKEEP